MVLFTLTPAIRKAVEFLNEQGKTKGSNSETKGSLLLNNRFDQAISHEQVIALSKELREISKKRSYHGSEGLPAYSLDELLRGSKVYEEAPKPKRRPVCAFVSST